MTDNHKTEMSDSSIPEMAVAKVNPNEEPKPPKCALSIHAHPDDQEFTVGATLAKWAQEGSIIISVCITSGDSGSEHADRPLTKAELIELREREQRAACEVLGVKDTVFLRYPDGMLTPTLELRRALTRLIRKYKPDTIVTGDPTVRFFGNSYMNHPDHRVAADVACDAAFPSAGTRLIFPELLDEGLEPHNVSRVFLHGSDKADVWIDISKTLPFKVCALQAHKSQLGDWDPYERMKEWATEEGKEHGVPLAESYRVMILREEKPEEEEKRQEQPAFAEAEG